MRVRSAVLAPLLLAFPLGLLPRTAGGAVRPDEASSLPCFSAETPGGIILNMQRRALAENAKELDVLAAIAVIHALAEEAPYRAAEQALTAIAKGPKLRDDLRTEASIFARQESSNEGSEPGIGEDRQLGILTNLSIVGPFRDPGGGVRAHDGPEELPPFYGPSRRYGWGAFSVEWRRLPSAYTGARGAPLDLFISPRKESCSWIATRVTVPSSQAFVVNVASVGQVRLVIDGTTVATDEDAQRDAVFDRLAASVKAEAGDHTIALKVCSGSIDDTGRARIHLTDPSGHPLLLESFADATRKGHPGSVAKHIDTPLERALHVGPPATLSEDRQLELSVLRTLGSADDTHNPKAHGHLSSFVERAPKLSRDRLALAAFISPSGADRSSWLARGDAVSGADSCPGAGAFITRRAIRDRAERGDAEWAWNTLRETGILSLKDEEAVRLQASALHAFGKREPGYQATDLLSAAARAEPTVVSTTLLRELASDDAGQDAAHGSFAREQLLARGVFLPSDLIAASRTGAAEVERVAELALRNGQLTDPTALGTTAQTASSVGAHALSRRLYETFVRYSPNRAEAWLGLATEIAATLHGDVDEEARTAALRRAKELAPTDPRITLGLELLSGGQKAATPGDDSRYIIPSEQLLARRKGVPKGTPTEMDREIYWLRAVVMHKDHRVSELVQYGREIVVGPKTRNENSEIIPAEGDDMEVVRAILHHKDGSTSPPVHVDTDSSPPRIEWPDLIPGDTVEVVFRSWTAHPVGAKGDPPFYRVDYVGATSSHPVLYNEIVIDDFASAPLFFDVVHGSPETTKDETEGAHRVRRLIWNHPENVADEPLAPPETETVPLVVVSTFGSWTEFRTWYRDAVRGFTEPDAQIRHLAARLTLGKAKSEDKLAAIFNFVADNIRYVNYVSAEGWLPNRPQQVLARKEGDCDDKAVLLIALLRAVGITTEEVLVQSRLTNEPSVLLSKSAAAPRFDHGIAFLPDKNGGRYLDATSPQTRLGHLPAMDARALAFRVDSDPAEVKELPRGSAKEHGSDATWTFALAKDGSAKVTARERHTGDSAFWLRTFLTEPAGRAEYVEDHLIGASLPTAMLEGTIDFDGELPHGEAEVRFQAKSQGYARREGDELVVSISRGPTMVSVLAPLTSRTLPVILPPSLAPSHEARTLKFIAPEGFRWEEPPEGGDVVSPLFGRAHLKITKDKDPRLLTVERETVFEADVILPKDYGAFRAWLHATDRLVHQELRLVKDTSASSPAH